MRTILTLLIVVCSLPVSERIAFACSCGGKYSFFEQSLREAPIVLIGRVKSIGSFRKSVSASGVPVVAVEVVWVAKGDVDASQVDVWTLTAGGSCPNPLYAMTVGTHAVFTLRPERAGLVAPASVLNRAGVRSGDEEVLVLTPAACGQSLGVFADERELARWVGKKIQ